MLDDLYAKLKDAVTNVFDLYINKPCFGASIEFLLQKAFWEGFRHYVMVLSEGERTHLLIYIASIMHVKFMLVAMKAMPVELGRTKYVITGCLEL